MQFYRHAVRHMQPQIMSAAAFH